MGTFGDLLLGGEEGLNGAGLSDPLFREGASMHNI